MPTPPSDLRQFQSLVEIVSALRGPNGCPWDKEQTHQSLSQYTIEECFEMVEAIESKDDSKIKDEAGDVLFQVVLHTQLAQERASFEIADVIQNISEKLIRRHPHVFANTQINGTEDVIKNWELIKQQEKANQKVKVLDVPRGLPALQRSHKIGKRTEKYKFDWKNATEVLTKVQEEMHEFQEALDSKNKKDIAHELGDVLFSLAQIARHLDIDPEQCLRQANQRFENRFEKMIELSASSLQDFSNLNSDQKEILWKQAKAACHESE